MAVSFYLDLNCYGVFANMKCNRYSHGAFTSFAEVQPNRRRFASAPYKHFTKASVICQPNKQPRQALAGGAVFLCCGFFSGWRHILSPAAGLGPLADWDGRHSQGKDGAPLGGVHRNNGEHPLEGRDKQHGQLHR